MINIRLYSGELAKRSTNIFFVIFVRANYNRRLYCEIKELLLVLVGVVVVVAVLS